MSKTFRAVAPGVAIYHGDSIDLAESNAAMILEDVLFPDFPKIEYPFSIDLKVAQSRLNHAKALLSSDWFYANFNEQTGLSDEIQPRSYLLRKYLCSRLNMLSQYVDGAVAAGYTTFEVF